MGGSSMRTAKPQLYIRIAGKTMAKAVFDEKGEVKPWVGLVGGQEVLAPNGSYYLRDDGKFIKMGFNPQEAAGVYLGLMKRARVEEKAEEIRTKLVENNLQLTIEGQATLGGAIQTYIAGLKRAKRPEFTICGKERILKIFWDFSGKDCLGEVNRGTLLDFKAHLERKGSDGKPRFKPKTVENYMMTVVTFFNERGIKLGLKKTDWPIFDPNPPEPYEVAEVAALLAAAEPRVRLMFQVLVSTGLRFQELGHLTWADVDFRRKELRIRSKPCSCYKCEFVGSWHPKNRKARTVPVSDGILSALKPGKPEAWVFGTAKGAVENHFERFLKEAAMTAGVPNAKLHRFRDTFITNKIQDGVNIVTVAKWVGHQNIQETVGYANWLDSNSPAARSAANKEDERYAVALV